jgi:dolichol-phosphate mannosyltransferase
MLSIIVPAYNEENNIGPLYEAVCGALGEIEWEMVIVDDHSSDGTPTVLAKFAESDRRVRALRLSRNCGAHNAILCGVQYSRGDIAATIAADLQDPPQILVSMVEEIRRGNNVVWAVREDREGIGLLDSLFSRIFHRVMRRILNRSSIPPMGADLFVIDRQVIKFLCNIRETNANVFALVQWAGFRQTTVKYVKKARERGTSRWSFSKKIKLFIDSIVGFSYLPIRLFSLLGVLIGTVGFIYAILVVINYFIGQPVEGWSSLTVLVLVMGGLNLFGMGVLGEYIWRALDESRGRPVYLVEKTFEQSRQDAPVTDAPTEEPPLQAAHKAAK